MPTMAGRGGASEVLPQPHFRSVRLVSAGAFIGQDACRNCFLCIRLVETFRAVR